MDNSKFGLSVRLMGLICYFISGYVFWAGVFLMMILLVTELNPEVKTNAVQSVIIALVFLILGWAWEILIDITNIVESTALIRSNTVFYSLLNIIKTMIIFMAGAYSLSNDKAIFIPVISPFVQKHLKTE